MEAQQARRWSTAGTGNGQGLSYWIEAICEAFLEMKADSAAGRSFAGSLEQHDFGPVNLNFVAADCQEVWRTRQAIARSRQDFFYLLHIRSGRLGVEQRGRQTTIQPGDCVLVDSKDVYRFSFPDQVDCLSVQIPQAWLHRWLPAAEDAVARPLAAASPWGATLAGALGNLAPAQLDALTLPRGLVAEQLAALLALSGGGGQKITHQEALLRRLRQTLRDRLHEADLDPAAVAAEHGLSKRYLHLLFASAGGSFGSALLELRLDQAKAMLSDRRFDRAGIGEIAWRCGFSDPSHFARRFRARFGLAPAAWRRRLRA